MRPRRSLAWLVLAAILLGASFCVLGAWQLQRMVWKHALIARIEARVAAAPEPPPAEGDWPAVLSEPHAWEYRRLRLQGEFLHRHEVLVQATTLLGAGHWVLAPLQLADGTLVLVNRGFVPPAQRDPARRGTPSPAGPQELTGLLRVTEPGGGFLRSNDPSAGRWHSRDVDAIAAAQGLPAARVAPFFVDMEATAATVWPRGGLTVLRFSDNHLVYAITWFVLAAMCVAAVVTLLRQGRRAPCLPAGHAAAA